MSNNLLDLNAKLFEQMDKLSDTRFKKGFTPWHTKELYSERLDKDGYILIKIAEPNKWVRKHRWLYEQEHGAIPENSVIIFADGNKNNLNIDNLLCVTRNELKVLNKCRLISSVAELTKTGLNVAKLKIKLAEIRKEKKRLNIREYLSLNRNKIVLAFDKEDIKDLLKFKEMAKNETMKGIIVSGKYIGFTDTYRLFAVEDTDKERKGMDTANLYSITLLNELFKAETIAILNNGKLAIQTGTEITEYEALNKKALNIKKVIESYEYTTSLKANFINKGATDIVWKMLKLTKFDTRKYFIFKDNKVRVEAYPNEDSKLILDNLFEYNKDKLDVKFNLNVKYIDLWLKYIKNEFFNISLSTSNSAIKFSNCNITYIVMPMRLL
ncbi:HNH endonuclease [Fusobacterium nucleatum]|uniref:HNH endonuclease n=1 Tax=Fusobacterium nucleatum TaxID=851 RepID=UPI0030D02F16